MRLALLTIVAALTFAVPAAADIPPEPPRKEVPQPAPAPKPASRPAPEPSKPEPAKPSSAAPYVAGAFFALFVLLWLMLRRPRLRAG